MKYTIIMKFHYLSILLLASPCIANAQVTTPASQINFEKGKKINVAYFIFDQVEALDLNGPLDVMEKANHFDSAYNIYTVSLNDNLVEGEGDILKIKAKYSIKNAPKADIIIFPGGRIELINKLCNEHPELLQWIKEQDKRTKLTMSVCLGSFFLAKAGLLDGKVATTHFAFLETLKEYPKIKVIENKRYIQDGKILTTGGITSGIDGALYVVEMVSGKEVADQVAHLLVYNRNNDMNFMDK